MDEPFNEQQADVDSVLRSGDLAKCERMTIARLAALPKTPFHLILNLSINNSPTEVAAYFDDFFRQEAARMQIRTAYTEMNEFFINPDRWFCDAFAYQQYGGHEDYDWLGDWDSQDYDQLTITGLERLQDVYASAAFRAEEFSEARDVTDLLVVIRFQDLIRRAAPLMREKRFPLLSTAHEFDFIDEV